MRLTASLAVVRHTHLTNNKTLFLRRKYSVSFPEKDEKGGWSFDILCMRRRGVRGICANAPLCAALNPLSCQSLAFFFQARCSTEPINLHIYQLLQSTPLEMQLGALPGLYRLHRYVQPHRLCFFLTHFGQIETTICLLHSS